MAHRLSAGWQDLRAVFSLSPLSRDERWYLLFISLAGMLVRVPLLSRPMVHDEAYTYVAFASRPFLALISDYHLPNNHIFHSLLVHWTTMALGTHPWTVRLPAFLAAGLCIPVLAVLGARMYSSRTGLLAATLLAGLPVQALYATNARGYSFYTLLTLVLFLLAQAIVSRSSPARWILMVLVAGLGFWTVPFMAYPFVGVMLWLSLVLWDRENRSFAVWMRKFSLPLMGVVAATGLFTALAYLPVVLWGTGWRSLVGNGFVQPLDWHAFFPTVLVRLQETADEWTLGLPSWVGWVISAGALNSILFHARVSRERFSPLLIVMIGAAGVVMLQRANPMARLWTALIPFWVLGGAVGWWQVWNVLRGKLPRLSRFEWIAGVVLLALLMTTSLRTVSHLHPADVQPVADLLVNERVAKPFVVAGTPDDAPLWFYLMEAGVGREWFESKRMHSPDTIFIVVRPSEGQTPQSVLAERGLDDSLCSPLRLSLWNQVGGLLVFRCEP
ncbi:MULTISPECIES: glycosyltransferase family 39 protein [Anaerolinea]|uniref:glycosyltransferase family 39 protein n=1 Tax=Anaerolinea TaxID=233189 RepID=UPI00260EC29D|nr:glycosyltransferase family 39 protein [Anaerolinea thermophila]